MLQADEIPHDRARRFERGAAEVAFVREGRDAHDGAGGSVVPVGTEETVEGRDKVDASRVVHLTGQVADLAGFLDQAQAVSHPLDS